MVGAGDAREHAVVRAKMAAVHSDISGAALRVSGNKRGCDPDSPAETRLLHRSWKRDQAELFQLRAGMNHLLRHATIHHHWLCEMSQGMAPFLVNLLRLLTAHAQ